MIQRIKGHSATMVHLLQSRQTQTNGEPMIFVIMFLFEHIFNQQVLESDTDDSLGVQLLHLNGSAQEHSIFSACYSRDVHLDYIFYHVSAFLY